MILTTVFKQKRGPFTAKEELLLGDRAIHLGIIAEKGTVVNIDGKDFEIGEKNILEFQDIFAQQVYFQQDTKSETIVDYITEMAI